MLGSINLQKISESAQAYYSQVETKESEAIDELVAYIKSESFQSGKIPATTYKQGLIKAAKYEVETKKNDAVSSDWEAVIINLILEGEEAELLKKSPNVFFDEYINTGRFLHKLADQIKADFELSAFLKNTVKEETNDIDTNDAPADLGKSERDFFLQLELLENS